MSALNVPDNENWQERLKQMFTKEEIEVITKYLEDVKEHGWGGVKIEFASHQPDKWFAWPIFSNQFGRTKAKNYKPE